MKLVFATQNIHKVKEVNQYLGETVEIIPLTEYTKEQAEETGRTFIENALIKAQFASKVSGLPALADDSGLIVPALNHAPGIVSARFAGQHATAEENNLKLLQAMRTLKATQRQAYFHCTLAVVKNNNDPTPLIAQGQWHGEILTTPITTEGFGYDPVFYISEQSCSAAELSITDKNQISHRGIALQKLKQMLADYSATN